MRKINLEVSFFCYLNPCNFFYKCCFYLSVMHQNIIIEFSIGLYYGGTSSLPLYNMDWWKTKQQKMNCSHCCISKRNVNNSLYIRVEGSNIQFTLSLIVNKKIYMQVTVSPIKNLTNLPFIQYTKFDETLYTSFTFFSWHTQITWLIFSLLTNSLKHIFTINLKNVL